MGGGPSRLYSALAQTLSNNSPGSLAHQAPPYPRNQGSLTPPEPADPPELLRECEEALRDRPPRPHRGFVCLAGDSAPNRPIRVMQWNILAQGKKYSVVTTRGRSPLN